MKYRVISMILVLVLAVCLCTLPVRASEGDWQYTQTEGGLRLTGYLGNEKKLTLPDKLAGEPVVEIGTGCFKNSKVTEITIPHGIRVIGNEAFSGCADLKKVKLSGSINVIGDRAFANAGLIKMDIPGCVRSIGAEAFLGCNALYNIVIEEGVEEWSVDIGGSFGTGSVKMEEGVESIGERAFFDCSNLTRMRLPKSVTTIGSYAIGYTTAGKQTSYQMTGNPGTAAERYAMENGLSFNAVEEQNGLFGICGLDSNWSWDPAVGTLTIAGTGRMYDYAEAKYLPWYGFRSAIKKAVVGEGITSLSEHAFSGSAVETVTLPESLAWFGAGAVANCADLSELTFSGNAPVFAVDTFDDTTITAWFPGWDLTWTREVRQNYGGDVTWRRYGGLPFVDVPESSFYYDAVEWALDNEITTGTDATHFSPKANCQRAAVVTFLWRAAGSPAPASNNNPFVDVKPSDFYYDAVLWAVERNITNGMDATHFGPFEYCNRAQVVTFLHRTMGSPAVTNHRNPFTDVNVDDWFAVPVLWAVREGITNGMTATTFGPGSICNRAQIVTFLYRTMAKEAA